MGPCKCVSVIYGHFRKFDCILSALPWDLNLAHKSKPCYSVLTNQPHRFSSSIFLLEVNIRSHVLAVKLLNLSQEFLRKVI